MSRKKPKRKYTIKGDTDTGEIIWIGPFDNRGEAMAIGHLDTERRGIRKWRVLTHTQARKYKSFTLACEEGRYPLE